MWSRLTTDNLSFLSKVKNDYLTTAESIVYTVLQQKYCAPDMAKLDSCAAKLYRESLLQLIADTDMESDTDMDTDMDTDSGIENRYSDLLDKCKECNRQCFITESYSESVSESYSESL